MVDNCIARSTLHAEPVATTKQSSHMTVKEMQRLPKAETPLVKDVERAIYAAYTQNIHGSVHISRPVTNPCNGPYKITGDTAHVATPPLRGQEFPQRSCSSGFMLSLTNRLQGRALQNWNNPISNTSPFFAVTAYPLRVRNHCHGSISPLPHGRNLSEFSVTCTCTKLCMLGERS